MRPRRGAALARLATRLAFEAGDAGVRRVRAAGGVDRASARGWRHVKRARAELTAYLAGLRLSFSVPLDLSGLPPFQAAVLAAAARVPFGRTTSYAALARKIGRPGAARAVGNALAANPLPILLPCHRVVRSDGTWGPYALGASVKTRLLALECATPSGATPRPMVRSRP